MLSVQRPQISHPRTSSIVHKKESSNITDILSRSLAFLAKRFIVNRNLISPLDDVGFLNNSLITGIPRVVRYDGFLIRGAIRVGAGIVKFAVPSPATIHWQFVRGVAGRAALTILSVSNADVERAEDGD